MPVGLLPSLGISKKEVELALMPSFTNALILSSLSLRSPLKPKKQASCICIWFCVRVPVLSVQITLMAPIVSQACIFLTKLLVEIMRRIFSAKHNVTLMGNPSGTAITIRVTAIMNNWRVSLIGANHSSSVCKLEKS